ncbi:MAG TPA: hypothetical protein VLA98_13395, partial [Solirubrobacteraceae bacterium]|nr:hypothetical protein [Solirubrobacteraceae bacterium]
FGFQGLVQGLASIAGQIVGGGLIALDVLGLGWRALVTRARERAPAMVPAREAAWPRAERRGSSGAWFAVAPGGRPRVSALPSSRPPPPRR